MSKHIPVERREIRLGGGKVLHGLEDGEGYTYGYVQIEANGQARIWRPSRAYHYEPTDRVFPGFVSAARAVLAEYL